MNVILVFPYNTKGATNKHIDIPCHFVIQGGRTVCFVLRLDASKKDYTIASGQVSNLTQILCKFL